jgi:crotonobetainyl-CoA hydratase/dehydration protein DpgD
MIDVTRRGSAAWITIRRPQVLNAIDPATATVLEALIREADADPAVKVIVVYGEGGRAFSVGADLKWRAENQEEARRLPIGGGLRFPGSAGFECWTPLIAAVDGYALGGGFELALACDFIIATGRSQFALPEVSVGLIADAGGIHRLVRQLPWGVAMDMILAGRRLDADEAKTAGLVSRVVPPNQLFAAVAELVERIEPSSPLAVRASKETATIGLGCALREAMATRSPLHDELLASEDAIEGPRAFAEGRAPEWSLGFTRPPAERS